jgi:hypothetical protein
MRAPTLMSASRGEQACAPGDGEADRAGVPPVPRGLQQIVQNQLIAVVAAHEAALAASRVKNGSSFGGGLEPSVWLGQLTSGHRCKMISPLAPPGSLSERDADFKRCGVKIGIRRCGTFLELLLRHTSFCRPPIAAGRAGQKSDASSSHQWQQIMALRLMLSTKSCYRVPISWDFGPARSYISECLSSCGKP